MKTAIIRMIKIMNSTMKTIKTIISEDMPVLYGFFSITIFGGLGVGFVVRYDPSERKRNKVHVSLIKTSKTDDDEKNGREGRSDFHVVLTINPCVLKSK